MMDAGTIGGLVGSALGLAGGIVGTYFTVRNTRGPLERAFAARASAVAWLAVIAFLAALFWTPAPYRFWLWAPYGILLAFGIRTWNRKQARIREEESRGRP
jgi:hypothetical protein